MPLFFVLFMLAVFYGLNGSSHAQEFTPTPTPLAALSKSSTIEPGGTSGLVTYDLTGRYAFPVAAEPHQYTWTHYHWDETNAVDIEARFGLSQAEFTQATTATLVAITSGVILNYSGMLGGQGYMLQGDDGLDYYYAHMSEQWLPNGSRVVPGQPLGIMGNSGGSAQFIEPHLHLAIGLRDTLWNYPPGINAAEHLRTLFHLSWEERPQIVTGYAVPQGWPAQQITLITPYDQAQRLAQPALEFSYSGLPSTEPVSVLATLSGEVNVIRWTAHYGNRIQITNREANYTVVISGIDEWLVQDGDVVSQGQVIARWNPAHRSRLHYMIFQNGAIIDPTPTLGY